MAIISASPVAVSEGAGYVDFIISLDSPSLSEVRVNYNLDDGTAEGYYGSLDFVHQSGMLVFAAGEFSKTLRVLITNNTTLEGTEIFWLNLSGAVNASVAQRYTPAFIFDNDGTPGTPAMSVSDTVVDESGKTATFWITLDRPAATPVSVNYGTTDGTARAGQDYAAVGGTLTFAAGEMVKSVTVPLIDDTQQEQNETFQLRLSNPTGASLAAAAGTATVGANDSPAAAAPYVSANAIAVSEGSTTATFVLQLSAPSTHQVSVTYKIDDGTALGYYGAEDFVYRTDTLVFAPGETTRSIEVPLSNGTVTEATEVFWLNLQSSVNAVVKDRTTPALIFDNDGTSGTPTVSVADMVVDESAGTASFFVSLSRASVTAVTVDYSTQSGTATAGSDFSALAGSLRFGPGEMVKTVVVDLTNDDEAEVDEFFHLALSNPVNATLGDATGTARVGHSDAPALNTPQVLASPIVVGEGETFAQWVVQLSAPSTQEVRVNFQVDDGSAEGYYGAKDFRYRAETLVFAPGETTKSVQVPMTDDNVAEPTEIFWLDLHTPVNATVPQRLTPALVIDNDGTRGTPAISVRDISVDESTHTASFFVTLNRPSASTVTVNYSTADNTAFAGSDFSAAAGSLTFAPGEVAKTVLVDLINDEDAEPDEFLDLVLSAPVNATLGEAVGTALLGRSDSAQVSTPYIVAAPVAVGEGEGSARFVVQLSAPSSAPVTVSYQTDDGSATGYYGALDFSYASGSLTFAPGETTRTVEVLLTDGTVAEGPEVFWLDLYNAVGAVVPERYIPAIVFDDDGTSGTPVISVSDSVGSEADQTARFFVSLSRPSTNAVSVAYSTADDTAAAGADYRSVSGNLVFAPGEMVKSVIVDLASDGLAETDERFNLIVSNPINATIVNPTGTATVAAGDTRTVATPQVLSSPISVSEGDPFAQFVVHLNAPSASEVRVSYQTAAGTATYSSSGQDFQYASSVLVFAPGETAKVVRVLLTNDTAAEGVEGFSLDLYSPVNASIPQRYITATITDNDNPGAVFSYGLGNDQYTVTSALDKIVESPGGGIDTVRTGISITLPDNVENLVLTGAGAINALGNSGNNIFRGTAAANVFDGKEGIDTVIFSGPGAAYTVSGDATVRSVSSAADGNDTLYGIERLQYTDYILATDTTLGGNTYKAFAMFNAAFDLWPTIPELSMWTAALDRLGSTAALAQAMINYYAPGVSDEVLVTYLWGTIVETPIPLDALSTYVGLVADGTYTQATLVEFVAEYELNAQELVGIVGQTLILDPAYFPAPG